MRESTYTLFDVAEGETSGEVRVERGGGGDGQDLGAVDEGAGVVADHGEHAHDELEVTLELDLIVCSNVIRCCR